MNIWNLPLLIIAISFLIVNSAVVAETADSDLLIVTKRLQAKALCNKVSPAEIQKYLRLQKANGSFSDIEYTIPSKLDFTANSKACDKIRPHLVRLAEMATVYSKSKDKSYRLKLYQSINSGLKFWVNLKLNSKNWWHRTIGFPRLLANVSLIMLPELDKTPQLKQEIVQYLLWSWQESPNYRGKVEAEANSCDVVFITISAAAIKSDKKLMDEVFAKVKTNTIKLQTEQTLNRRRKPSNPEGLALDYCFSQHCLFGRQPYWATYGAVYLSLVLSFAEITQGTSWAYSPEKITILEDMFIRGIQWFSFNKWYDQNIAGRKIGTREAKIPIGSLKRLIRLKTPRQAELENMLNWMETDSGSTKSLSGNKMFWLHDLMIHRRNNYYISFRMTSERTVANEGGLGQGLNNRFTGSGVTYVVRTGKEYNDEVFKRWSWSRLPGISVPPDASTETKTWGNNSWNNHNFAGGVSDGQIGAAGFIHNRAGVKANKSCFFFDNFMVALGAGIESKTENLITTLNQCDLLDQPVYVGSKGKVLSFADLKNTSSRIAIDWVHHNRTGYLFPKAVTKEHIQLSTQNRLFYLGIKHKTDKNADYAYLIIPDCSLEDMNAVPANNTFRILANNKKVQAVENKTESTGQAIIFTAGTKVDLCGFQIEASQPCAVMLRKQKNNTIVLSAANPQCNSNDYPVLKLIFNKKLTGKGSSSKVKDKTVIALPMPRGLNAGKTASLELKYN